MERKNEIAKSNSEQIGGSEQDLSRRHGIPPKGWQKLRWAHKGPPYYRRPGSNRVYYLFAEVDAWLKSRKVEPSR